MITKNPIQLEEYKLNYFFFSAARKGWLEILKATSAQKVLLPAYIGYTEREGSGVFDPVIEHRVNYGFYAMDENLNIDLGSVLDAIGSNEYDLILIIHYFGFIDVNAAKIAKRAKKSKMVVVEDCAHHFSMFSRSSGITEFTDFSFYSIHKYLAVNSGGAVKVSNPKYLKSFQRSDQDFDREVLISLLLSDYELIKKDRIKRFEELEKGLLKVKGLKVLRKLRNSDIPQTFPILIENGLREKLYFYLMNNKVPTTALYYQLVSNISKELFPKSIHVSDSILNLPIHQGITEADIVLIITKIQEGLQNIEL